MNKIAFTNSIFASVRDMRTWAFAFFFGLLTMVGHPAIDLSAALPSLTGSEATALVPCAWAVPLLITALVLRSARSWSPSTLQRLFGTAMLLGCLLLGILDTSGMATLPLAAISFLLIGFGLQCGLGALFPSLALLGEDALLQTIALGTCLEALASIAIAASGFSVSFPLGLLLLLAGSVATMRLCPQQKVPKSFLAEPPRDKEELSAMRASTAPRHSGEGLRPLWPVILCVAVLGLSFAILHGIDIFSFADHYWGDVQSSIGFLGAGLLVLCAQRLRPNFLRSGQLFPWLCLIGCFLFVPLPFLDEGLVTVVAAASDVPYGIAVVVGSARCCLTARQIPEAGFHAGLFFGIAYLVTGCGFLIGSLIRSIAGTSTMGMLMFIAGINMLYFATFTIANMLWPTRQVSPVAAGSTASATPESSSMEKADSASTARSLVHFSEEDVRSNEVLRTRYKLTDREIDVVMLLLSGRTMKSIATSLVISENTVRTHIRKIYGKLGVHTREQLLDLLAHVLSPSA